MADAAPTARRAPAGAWTISPAFRWLVILGGGLLCAALALALVRRLIEPGRPASPVTPVIAFHLATMTVALPMGMWIFLARKGTALHRTVGKVWMVLMLASAASSFGIRTIAGGLSFIHLFSAWTLFAVPRAYVRIRRGDVAGHRSALTGVFAGALLIAGAFTFAPGRILHAWAFG